ncbi:alpha/beta fold hydrolase [Nocardia sp. XZ_19_369]|uniref:alpha/beta fold hydrolase n=1 Tax=Nocardia sp. XZ_19_369 TaxID=2769487 RepID=UPI00188FEDD7|nr:alpha/beta hydrolase [Nocardia sp. XZ_19_369]
MPKIGRFTSDEAQATYLRSYDAMAARWPVPSTELDIETSFGTTRVRKSGSGDGVPLLLLPGMSGNSLVWGPFIEDLARDRIVYTTDVMGWAGRCVQTAPMRDETDIARWAGEVIAGLGANRVHLAGYSLGAWLAAVIAAEHCDRLASLSLLEPTPAIFGRPPWRVLRKFIAAGIRPTREKMQKLNDWLQPRIRFTEEEWEMILAGVKFRMALPWPRPLTDERLAAITAPVLALYGAESVIHDPEVAAGHVRRHFPAADIETYPSVGHDMLWAIPDQVISRFLDFAGKHDSVQV